MCRKKAGEWRLGTRLALPTFDEQASCLPEAAVGVAHGSVAALRVGGRGAELGTELQDGGEDALNNAHHRPGLLAQ